MNTPLKPNPLAATAHMRVRKGPPVPEIEPLDSLKTVNFVCPRVLNDPLEPLDVDAATADALTAVWDQAERDVTQILNAVGRKH